MENIKVKKISLHKNKKTASFFQLFFIFIIEDSDFEIFCLNTINSFLSNNEQFNFSEYSSFNTLSATGVFVKNTSEIKQLNIQSNIGQNQFYIDTIFFKKFLQRIEIFKNTNLFDYTKNNMNSLVAILVPGITTSKYGIEGEFLFEKQENNFFVATSMDIHWEQLIYRSIYKKLGLGDEFEFTESKYLNPNFEDGYLLNYSHPNLIYAENEKSLLEKAKIKWTPLTNNELNSLNLEIKKHSGHPEQADYTIPTHNYQAEKIQLWEGGGGYRTKVYRSAHDCLMRRQIGNPDLPVRASKVPLCPVCEAYIRSKLLEAVRYSSSDPFEFRQSMIQLNT